MKSLFAKSRLALVCVLAASAPFTTARADSLQQIISHENPAFNAGIARLTTGADGNVYLFHARSAAADGYMMRVRGDGTGKGGTTIHYSANGVAANSKGQYVVAEAHFQHSATVYGRDFASGGAFNEFNNENYDSPQWVEAGASDDFYAADLRGNRIVRVSPTGKKIAVYPVKAGEFRVSEKNQQFYVNTGSIDVYGFDGKKLWDLPIRVGGDIYNGFRGGYDVDDQGVLYVAAANSDKIQAYAPDGKPLREITLQMGEFAPGAESRIMDLRVAAGDLFIKRNSPTELFQRYDKATGARKNVVSIDFDRLTADYPDRTWTAGKSVPFKIGYTPSAPSAAPHWRVWARTFGAPKYREWSLKAGELQIPSDAAGLYQIKVSPEVDPGQRRVATEYLVRDIVQVLAPGSKGTVNAMTPDNRVYYGRGEAIPVSILVRAPAGNRPARVNLRLLHGKTVLAQGAIAVPATGAGQLTVPAALTAALRPGDYLLQSDAAGFTNVPQEIIIGEGTAPDSAFLRIQYGDYGTDMPYFPLTPFDAPEVTSFYAERSKRLGLNMVAERAGSSLLSWDADKAALLAEVTGRLEKDETGVAPEKAKTAAAFLQTAAAYSAGGIHYTPILLGNDASTTLGVGLDPRKPEVIASELTKVTNALLPYPAFRGWDWAANWWAQEHGVDAAKTPEQKKAYNEALAKARSTGEWNPVLDEVSDLWLQKAPETTKSFNDTLAGLTRAKKTAVSAPYRNVYAYPPVTFKNVDEVDLQFQAEQMYVPYGFLHNTDFYKRPGKRAWAHPELWNDSGTGEQILRELFGMTMRGVDGAGFSGSPGWWGNKGLTDDPRLAYNGTMSVYRAAFSMLRDYGPWLATLQNNDRVAIVAAPRMFRLDEWGSIYGTHFARVKEAFTACLHAHYPASIVFVDDMKPDTLKKYKAVLVVGQRVELEPMLTTALQAAKAAGTTVFYDGTCREELVKQYTPLGLSFNHFETDKHTWGDDPAFWQGRFPGYVMQDVPALKAKLGAVMKPVAETDNPEVLASERTAGQGRYIFVLNGTTPQIDPSQLWRQSLFVATRVPVTAPVTLNADGGTVYDMTAMKAAVSQNGVVNADLRASPLRVYAVLPAPIAGLGLRGPTTVGAGGSFAWGAWVQDAGGRSLEAAIPVRLRLVAADGRTLGEANAAAFSKAGAQGSFTVPLDMPAGALTLEATELVSGKSARLRVMVAAATLPLGLGSPALPMAETGTEGKGAPATSADPAPVMDFGPHIRDTILLGNGGVAVMNAMNWDSNLYGVDTATGKVLWKGRTGQAFTYAPQPVQGGFAVQGFDFDSPSGYHLYLADAAGKATRRFPLYGLGRRLPQRFLASLLNDRMNHFAAAPDGSWVASYGDLGLAVWDRGGKLLWQQDDWKQTHTGPRWRGTAGWNDAFLTTPTVAALDAATLLVIKDLIATAYDAASGTRKWQVPLASAGQAVKVQSSDDGKTIAVLSTTEGGRVFLLRGGKLVKTIAATGEDMGFAGDGSAVAVVNSTQLKLYGADGGLRWVHNGDEILVNPRIAADGRVAACSRLGTLYVLDATGNVLLQRDMGALVAPAWLPGGDLLASGWMGTVVRLAGDGYTEKWRTRLVPAQADMRGKLLEADPVPAAALPDWTNEAAKAAPLSPNLLAQTRAAVTVSINNQKVLLPFSIYDGKPEAPQKPWAAWNDVNWLGEGTAQNYIEMEMRGYDATVTGITLLEDAARPSSWLRDVYLQYWDPKTEDWVYALTLLSNSAAHTHMLPKPVSASRWRLMLPPGAVTNVSLGEIVLHGTATDQFFPDGQLVKTVADLPGNERFIWEDGLPTGVWKGATVVTEVPGTKPKTGTQALLLAAREALGATGEWTKAPWTAPVAWPVGARLKGWYYLPADQAGEPTLRVEVGLAHGDYAYTLANLKKGQWQEFSLSPDMLKNAKGETMDGTRAYPVLALKLFPEGTTTLYADSLRIE